MINHIVVSKTPKRNLRNVGMENLCKSKYHRFYLNHHDTYIPRGMLTQVIIKINGYILNVVFYVLLRY